MKLKKFITLGLAAVMATSAIGINAIAADSDNEIVYSYADENNNIINITQSDLDAEHWNKEALGDTAPAIYENFPMKMTGYTNDFSELSLDIVYMKKLEDMDKVSLTITDLNDGNIVYNSLLTEESFYSPVLDEKGQYDVELTEVIDGQTTNYKRIVCVKKEDAEMPSYVTNPSENNNDIVLIANTNDLRCGETTDDDGKIIVNPQIAKYTPIHANEFKDYCNSLPAGNIYRVFTISDNRQYAGFFSKDYGDNIYNLTIETYTESDFQYDDADDVENISGYKKPKIVCKEDDGTTNVNQKTLAGTYTLSISGADAENYNILYENGNLVIRQRPLIVQTVNNIPNLTSKEAFESDLVKNIDVKTDIDSSALTFAENRGPLWDDCVHITFDATYTDNSAVGETDVDITNAVLDTSYGDARNYYLQKIEIPQKGFAVKAVMTAIEITTDPTQNNDGTSREYKYGDKLDFSGGKFKLLSILITVMLLKMCRLINL